MMNYSKILLFIVLLSSCQGSKQPANNSVACSGTASPGLVCLNGQWTVASGGYCNNPSDCPPSLYCNTATSQCSKSSSTSTPIWFATDPIQPGINAGGTNGFVYNGMAKGYASLDDWCMSQAQQSIFPNMKNKRSWRALIVARPTVDLTRILAISFTPTTTSLSIPYLMPTGEPAPVNPPSMQDKNGNIPPAFAAGFWSGLSSANSSLPVVWTCPSNNYPCEQSQPNNFQVPKASPSRCFIGNNNDWGAAQGNGSIAMIPVPDNSCMNTNSVIGFFQSGDYGYQSHYCTETRYGCGDVQCYYLFTVDYSSQFSTNSSNQWTAQCNNAKGVICLSN